MNKRIILKGLGYVVGGACILVLGFFWGYREGMGAGGFSASLAELQTSENGMALQLKEGTCETAKKAINTHLVHLEKYKGKNELILPASIYHADKMLDHMRLFLIERHEGKAKEADSHLRAATDACKYAEMKDCSDRSLRATAL